MVRLTVLVAFVAACASDDPDVAGRTCFVLDLRRPHTCPAAQLVDGIDVHDVSTDVHVKTDKDGGFHLPLPAEDPDIVLRAAEDRADLFTSVIAVDTSVETKPIIPLITRTLWKTYVDSLHLPPDDPARAIVQVAFPPPGDFVATATIDGASTVLFDQGDAYVWAAAPPGDQAIVFMAVGVPVDTGTATIHITMRDDTTRDATVPVEAGAMTWVYLPL